MRALERKLWRDLWRLRGQALAIVILVGCAVAIFVAATSTHRSLFRSQAQYYERFRFADVFASVRRAPESLSSQIESIAGVSELETRVVTEAPLQVAGFSEPVVGRIQSVPSNSRPRLNQLYLRSGRDISPYSLDEVLISEPFALAHKLRPGDSLTAIIHGRRQTLRIVGVALSPEHIYQVRPGDLMPDDKRFGVLWMGREGLAAALNMRGAFNDICIRLIPGASEPDVLFRLDKVLEPYGGIGSYGRDRQVSHRFLTDEIRQLKSTAVEVPTIFLGVAAFLLHVVFSRLIATQREQIATLKALGYSNATVGLHFTKLVSIVVLCGVVLGTGGGRWLGQGMTGLYADYYRIPIFDYQLEFSVVLWSAVISLGAALLGVTSSVRKAVSLAPAEAMRPQAPPTYRATVIERLGIGRLLSQPGRMVLRQLGRRPIRALLSSLGLAMAVSILVTGLFFNDAMEFLVDHEFRKVERQDVTVTFIEPRSSSVVHELKALPGVLTVEPFRAVPVTLRSGHHSYMTSLLGLPQKAELRRVVGAQGQIISVPESGLLMTSKLASMLELRVGDRVWLEVQEGRRPRRSMVLAGLADELLGVSVYLDIHALNALMDEGPSVSGAFLMVDAQEQPQLFIKLRSMPQVTGVSQRLAMIQSFQSVSAETILVFSSILVAFAAAIAAGIVYNAARVSLAERERELATLRVIGFERAEVAWVLFGELIVQLVVALPLGCVLGHYFAKRSVESVSTDLYRIPVIITGHTYALAMSVVIIASLLVGLLVRHRLDKLDWVSVLKTKE